MYNKNTMYNTLNQNTIPNKIGANTNMPKVPMKYAIKNKTTFRNISNVPIIYLSDAAYAQNSINHTIPENKIGLIINASSDSPADIQTQRNYKTLGIDYLWVPIPDVEANPPANYLPSIVNYVKRRQMTGKNDPILIHCTAGINRSGLVAAAILWYTTPDRQRYWPTPKHLLDYMKSKQIMDRRTYLLINRTFYKYLLDTLK